MNTVNVTLYDLQFSYDQMFFRGFQPVYGEKDDVWFMCCGKSGSQSLWLPIEDSAGLKIFHPNGQSNTFEKVNYAYEAQRKLFECGVAPEPLELYVVNLNLQFFFSECLKWFYYGVWGKRVKCGVDSTVKVLEDLEVDVSTEFVKKLLTYRDFDALSLRDIVLISRFFNVDVKSKVNVLVEEYRLTVPEPYRSYMDLLTWSNILVDEEGKFKVVDFDLCYDV